MTNTKTIVLKDPINELLPHPLASRLPQFNKNDERFIALLEDMRDRGIDSPLLIDSRNQVVSDLDVLTAARRLELHEVPCVLIDDLDVTSTILGNLVHRKHYSKSALAYLAYPLMEAARQENLNRRLKNLKNSPFSRKSAERTIGNELEDFAESLGFGRTTFFLAKEINKYFESPKKYEWNDEPGKMLTLKEYFEPRILRMEDAMGLGAVKRGIGCKLSPSADKQSKTPQLELFTASFGTIFNRYDYFVAADERGQRAALATIRSEIAELPPERCEAMAELFAKVARELRERAKNEEVAT